MNRRKTRQTSWLGWLLVCGFVFGLTAMARAEDADESLWRNPWPFNKDYYGNPDRVVVFWSDTVLMRQGQPPIRGFGGRLMFYTGKKEAPIKVDGTLTVYAFDDTMPDPAKVKPDRKYIITMQQFRAHYSKSKIGHSYSVWLPWDPVGGPQKEISLIIRFEPRDGTAIVGEECKQLLPGCLPPDGGNMPLQPIVPITGQRRTPTGTANNAAAQPAYGAEPGSAGGVQQASYEAPAYPATAMSQESNSRRMTTTTISLPSQSAFSKNATSPTAQQLAPSTFPEATAQPQSAPGAWQNSSSRINPASRSASPTSSNQAPPRQFGYSPGRQRPLGEPLSRLDRDRAPLRPRPVGSQYAPGAQPELGPASAATAAPLTVPQAPN